MSDERLIRDLRALDRPIEVDPAFGEALYAILDGDYASRRQFGPSLTLLLVAALLVALFVGGVVAVGTGLRLPWTSDQSIVGPGAAGCPSDLPASQLLELVVNEDGYADPDDEWGPTAGFIVRVYDDGLLLTAGHGRTVEQIRAGDSGMTARRLSPTGIRLILEAAEQDALGSGCHDRWADIPERALSVRGDDGGVARVAWGRGSDFIRQMTDEELVAAERLVERLRDLESWLPDEAWVDATPRPYVPDRWLVNVQLPDLVGLADPEGARDRQLSLPDANEIVLPEGVTLLAIGAPYEEPDGAAAPGQPGLHGRCAVIGADAARSLSDAIADAGAVAFNQSWWLRFGSDRVAVAIRPMLPTDDGCTARMLGLVEPAGPSSSPLPQASGDLASVDPCGFVSEGSMRTAIEVPAGRPIAITDRTALGEMGRFGPEFLVCSYHLGEIWDDPSTVVHVRTSSTETDAARALAYEILGGGAIEEAVADRRVWHNGCDYSMTAECTPAIAISVEPYFIVVILEGRLPEHDLPSIARALASAVRTTR
jgi:hypothetical protein